MNKRVVITGVGMVTPNGVNVSNSWNNIINSKSGIKKINLYKIPNLNYLSSSSFARKIDVGDFPNAISSGVPTAIIWPPFLPPPGPISII